MATRIDAQSLINLDDYQLRTYCEALKLSTSGTASVLRNRLRRYLEGAQPPPTPAKPEVPAQQSSSAPASGGSGIVRVVTTSSEWRAIRKSLSGSIGLVPTMGCLHEGHLQLVRICQQNCDNVVVSIFVNPAQFAPHEDFDAYPRQLAKDVESLKTLGVNVTIFAPTTQQMYPDACPPHPTITIKTIPPAYVDVERFVAGKAEALSRKGFFSGVATVCTKLFNIVRPDVVVFGKKDRLQCYVIQQIVKDLSMPIDVILAETSREPSGLAMSSRNKYLSPQEFEQAANIHKAMCKGRDLFRSGCTSLSAIVDCISSHLRTVPGLQIVYVVISDHASMTDFTEDTLPPEGGIVSLAVKLGPARLIDNMDL